jgi:acetyl/propionyl-CoA carboxylase alpha subunit
VPIYYEPLISKLAAWGADRPQAIARMRRALQEYDVRGIRTTIPFFRWMVEQPAFAEAAFHTGFLDELLQRRQGTPFFTADASLEEVAAIALAVLRQSDAGTERGQDAGAPWLPAAAGTERTSARRSPSAWKTLGRVEGLRS